MGCDIHWYVEQRQADGIWKLVYPSKIFCLKDEHGERVEEGGASAFDQAKWPEVTLVDSYADEIAVIGGWKAETSEDLYVGRHYDLFSLLAGVRGDFVPIAEPRGTPTVVSNGYLWEATRGSGDLAAADSFGDHSHSWLGLDELLAVAWDSRAQKQGWIGKAEFIWAQVNSALPRQWAGSIGGGGVKHVSNEEMVQVCKEILDLGGEAAIAASRLLPRYEGGVHHVTKLVWEVAYVDYCEHFITKTIPAMKEFILGGDPTSVRAVFHFDN